MSITDHADAAVSDIAEALGAAPSEDLAKDMNRIILQAIIDAVLEERSRCVTVAANVCSADKDLAHKIADEIRLNETALIANLSSMR